MSLYFGETEMQGLHFGDTEITGLYFGNTEIWTAWAEYDGTLPAQYSANGSMLADYRIYGSAGGVGDETKNLFNAELEQGTFSSTTGAEIPSITRVRSKFEDDVIPAGTYTINAVGAERVVIYVYDATKNWVSAQSEVGWHRLPFTFTINNAYYVRFAFSYVNDSEITLTDVYNIMLNAGSKPIPYGYEVNMSVSDGTTSTTTPIYIGDTPLGEDEYVDYGEQKVYRRTENLVGIFESVEINGIRFKFDGARVYISGTASAVIASNNANFKIFKITLLAGTYRIMEFRGQVQTGFGGWVMWAVSDNTRIAYSNTTFTLNEDTEGYIGFYVVAGSVLDFSIGFVILPESEGAITEYIPYYDPQDPPVPLPQLPTVDGVTITDYAGQSSAVPSRFYAKYKKGGQTS